MRKPLYSLFSFLFLCNIFSNIGGAFAYTKEEIIERGKLNCGISSDSPGFSELDGEGNWRGLHTDICRAIAAAVLGDSKKVTFIPLKETGAYTALLTGKVDLLLRHGAGAEWTFIKDTALPVNFAGVSFYDEMGVLFAGKEEQLTGEKKLSLCTAGGDGEREAAALRLFLEKRERKRGEREGKIAVVQVEKRRGAEKFFLGGKCSFLIAPASRLAALQKMTKRETTLFQGEDLRRTAPFFSQHILFGPVVRQGDDGWFDIVRWTLFVMIGGEEFGITSGDIAAMKADDSRAASGIDERLGREPELRRFLGEGNSGKSLGLANDWAAQVIGQVGNYGEVFSRNLGENSELHLQRGVNRLLRDGGGLYMPPLR